MSNDIAKQDTGVNVQPLIEQAMKEGNIDVLEKILNFQERLMTKQSEMNFNTAMGRLQEKLPRIRRVGSVAYEDKKTGQFKEAFKFARYEDIDAAIRPFLLEEGFSLSFDTKWSDAGATIFGTITHREGHSRTVEMRLPLDASGGKNNLQGMGSTISYGKRYAVGMLLNIITVAEDDDGTGTDNAVITAEQVKEITDILTEKDKAAPADKKGSGLAWILKHMNVEKIEDIHPDSYAKALNAAKALGSRK